ncbi:MAG TPA: hypothetical protein VJ721_03500 [Chthoniobacterales bacterium]|nr:hypothetical protein [Chthoniobacterales bacterium]
MVLDPGTIIGITGATLALISLAYTRSQAAAQRAQVEEMRRQTEQTRRAQHFETSHMLMRDAMISRHQWMKSFKRDWIPAPAADEVDSMLEKLGDLEAFSNLRMYVELLQEMYFARKTDMVTDDHWTAMHTVVHGFFTPQIDRELFASFVRIGMITREFADFANDFVKSGLWKDPLGRLAPQKSWASEFGA